MLMLVDDDRDVIKYFEAVLKELGFQVEIFTDSPKALHAYEDTPEKYSHVILDAFMPKLTGMDLAERIRAVNPEAKILFLTGLTDTRNVKLLEGMGEYMNKSTFAPDVVNRLLNFAK